MTFPERLEALIKENKTSQKEIAEYAGVRYASISDWKKDGSYPRSDIAIKIAKKLGTTVEFLVNGEEIGGFSQEIITIAHKIAGLDPVDRQDILDFIDVKLKNRKKEGKNMETTLVKEPEPAYQPDISSISIREEVIDNVVFYEWRVIEIPLLGSTAAGHPIDFGDLDPDPPTRPWAADLIRDDPKNYFCVFVRGDSMTEADIKDGDHALIHRAEKPENGEIMLVRHENASTLKRIKIVVKNGREETWICWEDGSKRKVKLAGDGYEIQGYLEAIERKARKR
jgi:SOS-response transcriptional repressor LexA